MTCIRVLQIVSGVAIGAQSGGAEQFAARLALGLPAERFERALFAMWRYGGDAEDAWLARLEASGVTVGGLISLTGRLASDLRAAQRALWRFTDVWRPEVVNSHSERGDLFNAVLRLLHPSHLHSVRTMHTDQQWQTQPWAGALLSEVAFPLLFDAEIAISEQTREAMDRRPLARRLRKRGQVLYNGIEATWFELPPPAPPVDIPPGRPALIVVGRLAEQKGHAYLLKALARVRERLNAHLWIVGTGALEEDLRQQAAALGIANACHFLGSRSDVRGLLAAADLMVLPSLWEGFPTVILEAMATKLPVVATEVSGSRELVLPGQTGLLAPPGNPEALAEAILAMLSSPSVAVAMAERAWHHAHGFTIENTITRYADLYERLARR